MKFDFITDLDFRNILERDYEELNKCIESKSSKSVLILAGSIIEAVLTDYFISFPVNDLKKQKVLKMDLYNLIELSVEQKLISKSTKDLSSVIKNYRNLIHPGREVRTSENFDFDTAIVAKSLLNIIVKEIRENYLNHLGYSANDLFNKLQSDELSQPIFEKLLKKVHKVEKSNLFNMLLDNELDFSSLYRIQNPKKYIRLLKPQIDRTVIEKQLQKLIHKIETGERWEVIEYYKLLHEELNLLVDEDIEFIVLYVLNAFSESCKDSQYIENYSSKKLFTTFGTHLTTEAIKKEFLKLTCNIVKNFENKDYIYFTAYDQLINSVTADKKDKIKEFVMENVPSYYHKNFYNRYDDGNFLPF